MIRNKRMKGIGGVLVLMLLFTLLSSSLTFASGTDKRVIVIVNNKKVEFEYQPMVEGDEVLVPAESILDALGLNFEYSEEEGNITVTRYYPDSSIVDLTMGMAIGRDDLEVGGSIFEQESQGDGHGHAPNSNIVEGIPEPRIVDGVLFIPFKEILENIGAEYDYGNDISTIKIVQVKYTNEKSPKRELKLLKRAIDNVPLDNGVKLEATSEVKLIGVEDEETTVNTSLDIYSRYDKASEEFETSFTNQSTTQISEDEEYKFDIEIVQYENELSLMVEQNGKKETISLDLEFQEDFNRLSQINASLRLQTLDKMMSQLKLLRDHLNIYQLADTTIEKAEDGSITYISTIGKEEIEERYVGTYLSSLAHYDEVEFTTTATIDNQGRLTHVKTSNTNINNSEDSRIAVKMIKLDDEVTLKYDLGKLEVNRQIVEFNKNHMDVQFPDPALRNAVMDSLEEGQELTDLKELNISESKVVSLEGISNLTNLEVINVSNNGITDISHLEGLTNLKTLNIEANSIEDYSVLESFEGVEITK